MDDVQTAVEKLIGELTARENEAPTPCEKCHGKCSVSLFNQARPGEVKVRSSCLNCAHHQTVVLVVDEQIALDQSVLDKTVKDTSNG